MENDELRGVGDRQGSSRSRSESNFVFQYFMEKWMLTKFKRFDQARKWVEADKKVTPKAKELMSEQAENSRYHDISLSNEDVGFVRDMRGSPPVRRRVNLLERTCTCSLFYQYGIPCSHIYSMLAYLLHARYIDQPERIFDFFDRCYLVETYMRANDAATSNIGLVLDDHIQADEECNRLLRHESVGDPEKNESLVKAKLGDRASKPNALSVEK
ncbi:hypothetical protein PInf_005888 [Phytophthora infestans]|nr:hypothetical protein PInf_005888 [Phytophthora infestans]